MHSPAPRVIESVLSPRFIRNEGSLSEEAKNATVVIGICIKNQAQHIPIALASALEQQVTVQQDAVIVILDDSSEDNWQANVGHLLKHPQIVVLNAQCGTASRARNALLDWVDEELPYARWVARIDADDRFADTTSVGALIHAGESSDAHYILGSNHLELNRERLSVSNIAAPSVLLNRSSLLSFIEGFGLHDQQQELPSCNLILRTRSGIRYPDVISAEDHWLVAELLMISPHLGVIVPSPVYSIYSLGGAVTEQNRRSSHWKSQRKRLAVAAKYWHEVLEKPVFLLGVGQEGIVWRDGKTVYKKFYSQSMNDATVMRIEQLITSTNGPVPNPKWVKQASDCWQCNYPWFDSDPLPKELPEKYAKNFLKKLHKSGYITSNIKRTNLRIVDDELVYIDIGKDINPFTPSRFLDVSARLYSITVLGNSDYELARRPSIQRQHDTLNSLPGFSKFYRELIEAIYPHCVDRNDSILSKTGTDSEVTLLIKCCAQDAGLLEDQISHIVSQLSYPVAYASIVLLVDQHTGPFLREFSKGDIQEVQRIAEKLKLEGTIDQVWYAPTDESIIRNTYLNWFGRFDISESHTAIGAPLFSQLWAFHQVSTPYVMQCDSDVLIGRRDLTHNYLGDMKSALSAQGVICVGFNIPQPVDGFKDYSGSPGEFSPEIRCGLLHIPRMRNLCPLPNRIIDNRFELMWHRSIQSIKKNDCRSVRGGDSRTYYLHPMNCDKGNIAFPIWRDLIAQGLEPIHQKGKWDLLPDENWVYARRNEKLVFLLKGRNTSTEKLHRCLTSLQIQNNQQFGLIIIDDGSPFSASWKIPLLLGPLQSRTSLIRNTERLGYIRNFKTAVGEVCSDPETLIVILDLDDALMSSEVTSRLYDAIHAGADLINGAVFRPEKPLHLYTPDYHNSRQKGGGNVWMHMRGFRKRLFDCLPDHYLQYQGKWVDSATDYALMLPLSEIAKKPIFIDNLFCYYHQRDAYTAGKKLYQKQILDEIFKKSPANISAIAVQTSTEGESC